MSVKLLDPVIDVYRNLFVYVEHAIRIPRLLNRVLVVTDPMYRYEFDDAVAGIAEAVCVPVETATAKDNGNAVADDGEAVNVCHGGGFVASSESVLAVADATSTHSRTHQQSEELLV